MIHFTKTIGVPRLPPWIHLWRPGPKRAKRELFETLIAAAASALFYLCPDPLPKLTCSGKMLGMPGLSDCVSGAVNAFNG
jgi:hypothetical protein